MYANPNFIRGHPEKLSLLRKCNTAAARKRLYSSFEQQQNVPLAVYTPQLEGQNGARTVSPPTEPKAVVVPLLFRPSTVSLGSTSPSVLMSAVWPDLSQTQQMASSSQEGAVPGALPAAPVSPSGSDSGKLNLLAMAMSSMAERDFKLETTHSLQKV
jgi:hypothetical protein